jgi:nucleoside-triphosphatase
VIARAPRSRDYSKPLKTVSPLCLDARQPEDGRVRERSLLVAPTRKNILLTGPPGCGKTTGIRRLLGRLDNLRLRGFYTQELREHGQRVGFEAVGLSGRRAVLAHVRSRSKLRVGRYDVDPERLRPLVEAELGATSEAVDAFVVDEIGKMEMFCPAFVEAVPRLLDGPVPVVATVALKGQGLIASIKARSDIYLLQITEANRDGLPEQLEHRLRGLIRNP